MKLRIVSALMIMLLAAAVLAETNRLDRFLIKNAVLIDDAQKQDQVIHLVVSKGDLILVTTDSVPEKSGDHIIDAQNGTLLGRLNLGEPAWRTGPFLLNGEYVLNQIDSSAEGDPRFTGFHVTASYVLTGEMRPYSRKSGLFAPGPVAKPVNHGGWGAWEVSTRFSTVDLNEGTIQGGEMDVYSIGLNWWLTSTASFSANYRHVVLGQWGETGRSDGLMTRLVLILE